MSLRTVTDSLRAAAKRTTLKVQHREAAAIRQRYLALPELIDRETGWYRAWYFRARLNDEVSRAAAAGEGVRLVYFRLPLGGKVLTNRLRVYLAVRLELMERESGNSFFGRLADDEFAVCVSSKDNLDATATVAVLQQALSGLSAEIGVAALGADGEDGPSLLEAARENMDGTSNLVYFEEYQGRRYGRAA